MTEGVAFIAFFIAGMMSGAGIALFGVWFNNKLRSLYQ